MRVAVTGASGFIGSHVVDQLMAAGHEVTVVDRRRPHRTDVRYRDVDILDLDALVDAIRGMEVVFHLAAVADVNEAAVDPVRTWELNVLATARVWEAARRNDVRRTILASTVWVYGGAVGDAPLDEDAPFALEDLGHVYTSSKVAAEMVAHASHALYGQEFTILRYGIPFGPRMRSALVVARFVEAALRGEKLTVNGDGSQYRNYVYVEDLARAHVLALHDSAANGTFNLEGGEPVTIRRLVGAISDVVGPVDVEYSEARVGDYEGRAVSGAKAARQLGWEPTTPFEVGLRHYVDWFVTQHDELTAPSRAEPAATAGTANAPSGGAARVVAAAAAALVLLPLLLGPAARTVTGDVPLVADVMVAAGVAWFVARSPWRLAPAAVGVAMVSASVWLLSQTSSVAVVALIAVGLGAGVGVLLPDAGRAPPAGPIGAGALLVALAWVGMAHVLAYSASILAFASAAAGGSRLERRPRVPRASVAFCAATAVFTVAVTSWVGATSASASWFGSIESHGPRDIARVALTFDAPHSGEGVGDITSVLDRYGVKATFFTEGASGAGGAERRLVAAGHEVGAMVNNEQSSLDLLEPGYPAAVRSQHDVLDEAGVCPVFLRPQGGRHTPLMVHAVHRHRMRVVGWDVSPAPAKSRDSVTLAIAVLHDVRPGSIVDLRGSPAVIAGALPLVIDGLRARGLEPVSLDQLLHVMPYAGAC